MAKRVLPLKEVSIEQLFTGNEKKTYEIPIYQRNYAWEKDEISTLVQDIYDAYKKDRNTPYYIGTLVSYHKGDGVFEIIDGQQRLTTIRLLLYALNVPCTNRLTYRARKKSDNTLSHVPKFDIEEKDKGIENGYKFAKNAVDDLVSKEDMTGFISFFKNNVHIIHYHVPRDIELNHYFEIMNSRGEQLEKHEIVKANLMQKLPDGDESRVFNCIWECCASMSTYAQQNLSDFQIDAVFGNTLCEFIPQSFDELVTIYRVKEQKKDEEHKTSSIADIIRAGRENGWVDLKEELERKDSFQPIIDFPNFLLIVLKITRMSEEAFSPIDFQMDDKELLNEFSNARMDENKVKRFAYNLLKAKFYLDNYVVHHSKEEDTLDSNPWNLQVWHKDKNGKSMPKNLVDEQGKQDKLAHLLSMFEVSFTARQRKNYLLYCLLYLLKDRNVNLDSYITFVENLADRYFHKVYLVKDKLNAINTPIPGSFDEAILEGKKLSTLYYSKKDASDFVSIYGDGVVASKGIPLFIFNYLDYKLWKKYDEELRGKELKEESSVRKTFFEQLGCGDFGLKVFDQFYFSRTRRSLEHYYPQANATGEQGSLDQDQINCLGNYAMIGSEANSSGSNWSPKTKLDHYLDPSGKISQISVASLKFMIMMRVCKDRDTWGYDEIINHQKKMLSILTA